MYNLIKHKICERNYKKKLKQIKEKKDAINVIFLSCENEKWGYQSLYDLLTKDERFNPIVLVGFNISKYTEEKDIQKEVERNYNFFKAKGMNVDFIYKEGNFIELKSFKPDIVFYEQRWGLPKKLRPQSVSEYALTCYCSYSFQLFNYKDDYVEKFHSYLYKFFADSDCNIKRYETYNKSFSKNCVTVGYPKLDEYLNKDNIDIKKYWKNPEKFKIIYSPHHSFGTKGLRMATFKENGQFILDLAKNHPETTWIFKPHPLFKVAIIQNNIMSEAEVEKYYKAWEELGAIYTQGDYLNIFKTSDLMITDCCSFLAEYLPSGKPLIRLLNEKSTELNILGKEVVKGYYQVLNNQELEKVFNEIVLDKTDSKKEIRIESQKNVIDFEQKSCEKILETLKI